MKMTVVLLSTLIATSAFAGSISLDTRIDADNASFNSDAGMPGYSKFYLQTGRIDFKGNAAADLSYRVRLRFNKDQTTVNKRDSLNENVDFAQLTHKMGDYSLTVGKFDIGTAGFEGTTAGPDMYFTSMAYGAKDVDGTSHTITATSNGIIARYSTGMNLNYVMGDHSFTLLNVNLGADTSTGGNFDQSRSVVGLVYKGGLMDKTLNLIGSYHTYGNTFGTTSATTSLMTVGAQYKMDATTLALDYNTYSLPKTATTTDKVTSIVGTVGYAMSDMNSIKAKLESSSYTADGATAVKTSANAMGLAFECKPVKDADFRYHAAYTTRTDKADSTGAVAKTENHFIVGTRLAADFLK